MLDALFTGNATWFAIPALLGTLIFVIRLAMMLLGSHGLGMDHGIGHAGADSHHGDSGDAFRLLSFESINAFMMGFGWGGLGVIKGTDWGVPVALLVGLVAGSAMLLLQALVLRSVSRLHASGNVSIKDALGVEGVVYIAIPGSKRGAGQVTLVVDQKQRQFNAITPDDELPSQTRVRVIGVNDDNTVTVQRAA